MVFAASERHVDYLRYKEKLLGVGCNLDFGTSGYTGKKSIARLITPTLPCIARLDAEGRLGQIQKLDRVGLGLHFLDDGTYGSGVGVISCAEWSKEECEAYADKVREEFPNCDPGVMFNEEEPRISLRNSALKKGAFFEHLKAHCPESMEYKLGRPSDCSTTTYPANAAGYAIGIVQKVDIGYIPFRYRKSGVKFVYCLEVEGNHNFTVGDGVVVSNCHRATLGEASQKILNHFSYAKVLGVTATPFRSDRKELGNFYEKIAIEIGLDRLIREGFLSKVQIKSFPMSIDLRDVGVRGGDYAADDLGAVIEPILQEAANQLVVHAADRKKIVVFLPLVKTSIRMARILNDMGIKAVHVSGDDRSQLRDFTHGDARVICNAQLLTTGWDCPQVDCVLVLRPTKSLALYQQCVGRGTRIHPGKDKLLLLDPLFLTDDHRLITPARLVARDEEQAKAMMEKIAEDGEGDLLEVEFDIEEKRADALKARMEAKAKKKGRVVDAIDFALSCGDLETAEFQPEFGWESNAPSQKQMEALQKAGFDITEINSRGQASRVLDLLFVRRQKGLATPKQVKLLRQLGHPSPATPTFEQASAWIDAALGKGTSRVHAAPQLSTRMLIRLRAAGLKARDYSSDEQAEKALSEIGAAA